MIPHDPNLLDEMLSNARSRLLAARTEAGHWEGELASSALSTATALFALSLHARLPGNGTAAEADAIAAGIAWLNDHQNEDGGWGDTVLSLSNISTTALVWSALSVAGDTAAEAASRAQAWLGRAAGSIEPDILVEAIARRYGKDRTFSVPILTMCALAGRLGRGAEAWRRIPQLPFELAACPHQWFRWLRLPVVSYALPALIAMGLARHRNAPTRNPLLRALRAGTRAKTLRVLGSIQPAGGGFLEATPLTSFVVMSLIAAGEGGHPVVREGVAFLLRSVRPDGSWPIDTNLATWVTTLSVNATAGEESWLSLDEQQRIVDWLLGQHYRQEHPYTHAAPGGWAWTDLPGGVPDADDTAGALLALRYLAPETARDAAIAGVRWLLDLQNSDGGIPTFCRGWGTLPFDRSGQDLTAHALMAWHAWGDDLPADLQGRVDRGIDRARAYLHRTQRADGAWVPLWFGNQHAREEENPVYGTARVLIAINEAGMPDDPGAHRAAAWLLRARNADGGWGGEGGTPSSIEETSLAVQALAGGVYTPDKEAAVASGVEWLAEHTDGGRRFDCSPIGFYFAKLWYFERLYPLIFTVAALRRARRFLSRPAAPSGSRAGS